MIKATNKAIARYGLEVDKNGKAVDNQADAFRHAYMQCWLTYRFGERVAKYFGDNHEHGINPDTNPSTNIDLWNNVIGREIGKEIKKEYGSNIHLVDPDFLECISMQKVKDRMDAGELITTPADKRRYTNMQYDRLQDKDRVFYSGELYDGMDEEERNRFSDRYIKYQNMMQMDMPTKEKLDKRVQAGELIYVKNYTRGDGVKVNGYYRRRPIN